jgi:hypothetical protein
MMNRSNTITRSLRILPLLIPLTLAGARADNQQAPADQQARPEVVLATITNMLAADGCSYPVTVDGVDYAPDARSTERMRQIVPFGRWSAEISYSLTGNVGQVECGFGQTVQLPEITVRVRRINTDQE